MEKKWEEMSAKEKRTARSRPGCPRRACSLKADTEAGILKRAVIRFSDAIQMEKAPDRVPILLIGTFMASQAVRRDSIRGHVRHGQTGLRPTRDFLKEYGPTITSRLPIGSGRSGKFSITNNTSGPATAFSEQSAYQAVEGEYNAGGGVQSIIDDRPILGEIRMPRVFGAPGTAEDAFSVSDLWSSARLPDMIPFGIPPSRVRSRPCWMRE